MNNVFVDTVGLIAAWDVQDQWHAAADGAYHAPARTALGDGRRSFSGNAATRPRAVLIGNEST